MAESSNVFKFIMYADDTTLSSFLKMFNPNANKTTCENEINSQLTKINNWLKINKLSLNINKTKFMIFHMPNKQFNIPRLLIDGTEIEMVNDFNLVGIYVNVNLN